MRSLPKWKCTVCTLLLLGFTIDVFGAIGMVQEARNEDLSQYNSADELFENAKVCYRELVELLRQSPEMQNKFSHVRLDSAPTWYELLGVDGNASVDDIQKAFRRLARLGHSDRGGDDIIFKAVNVARQEGIVRANSEIKVYETTYLFGLNAREIPHVRLADILPPNLKRPFEEIDKLLRQCKLFYISEGIIFAVLLYGMVTPFVKTKNYVCR